MHEASQLLFGIKHPPSCVVPDVSHPIEPTFSQRDDLFWKNAENLRAVEDIERAIFLTR